MTEPGRTLIPPVTLTAGAFLLRPPGPDEHAEVLALGRDPDVRLWNPRCRIDDEEAAVRDCLDGADWSDGSHATFSVVHRDTGRYAGNISLHGIDRGRRHAHIGYRVAPWTRGQGAATAGVGAVTHWAANELDLDRVLLTHAVGNPASCRVAAKCGFTLEETLPRSKRFGDGRLHDEHLHVLQWPGRP